MRKFIEREPIVRPTRPVDIAGVTFDVPQTDEQILFEQPIEQEPDWVTALESTWPRYDLEENPLNPVDMTNRPILRVGPSAQLMEERDVPIGEEHPIVELGNLLLEHSRHFYKTKRSQLKYSLLKVKIYRYLQLAF
jgi:hypothetical protein